MFDEFLEDYKYNWKMADKKYMEECYRKSLSPKQIEKARSKTRHPIRDLEAQARPIFSFSDLAILIWNNFP